VAPVGIVISLIASLILRRRQVKGQPRQAMA
jgi:hypothetical protein